MYRVWASCGSWGGEGRGERALVERKKTVITENHLKDKTWLLSSKECKFTTNLYSLKKKKKNSLKGLLNSQLFSCFFVTVVSDSDLKWNIYYTQSIFILILH